jgi:hypothetical protein
MTAALGIAVGIAALAAGLLRLGFLANFISEPLLKGCIVGLALTIIVGQLPKLLGLGVANLGAGLSSGMVVNGSLSETAVNSSSGARSQLSGLLVAALTILTLLLLTGPFEALPEATLAAVVIAALIELVDIPSLLALYKCLYEKPRRSIWGRRPARLHRSDRRNAWSDGLRHAAGDLHRHLDFVPTAARAQCWSGTRRPEQERGRHFAGARVPNRACSCKRRTFKQPAEQNNRQDQFCNVLAQ